MCAKSVESPSLTSIIADGILLSAECAPAPPGAGDRNARENLPDGVSAQDYAAKSPASLPLPQALRSHKYDPQAEHPTAESPCLSAPNRGPRHRPESRPETPPYRLPPEALCIACQV